MGISRRTFLIAASAAVGGGLAVAVIGRKRPWSTRGPDGSLTPNAFIRISRDGRVSLVMHKVEMGQGTYTAMAMLLAEELEIGLERVNLEHAPPDNDYYAEPLIGEQMTGGSTSVRGNYEPLRRAGATARALLVAAAAAEWNVAADSCRTSGGSVMHAPTGRLISYGALADRAASLPVPRDVRLKHPRDFRLIGTHVRRLDGPDKVTGRAQFSIDAQPPGVKIAVIATCPVFGGRLVGFDATKARAVEGVRHVVGTPDSVAVIADDTWAAKQGLAQLVVHWDEGEHAQLDTATIARDIEALSRRAGSVAERKGQPGAGAARTVEATYQLPFLAHATMEPVSCTVHIQDGACDVWVGTQVPVMAREAAARAAGLSLGAVRIHNHLLGGGFGRRLEVDFIERAVLIARQVQGPVKVIWTREEDIQHDMYRPFYFHRLAAGLDASGRPISWRHRIVGPSIIARTFPPSLSARSRRTAIAAAKEVGLGRLMRSQFKGIDTDAVSGALDLPYALPATLVDYVRYEPPGIPTAWWRGVGPTSNVLAIESFMDELANAARQDPVAYRRALLRASPRALGVLELAAARSGWGSPLPTGHGRGVALLHAFGSYLAQVAEVSVSSDGDVRVLRVTCAIDCGRVVNPDTVAAQMQGGIIFGLTGALFGEITLRNGRVEQSNFHDYQMLRMNEAPRIDVHLVHSEAAPGGVGEPGTSGAMPALVNAIHAATGKRLRRLPVKDQLRPAAPAT